MAAPGHLNEFLVEQQRNRKNNQQKGNDTTVEHPSGMVHVIYGVAHPERIAQAMGEMQ